MSERDDIDAAFAGIEAALDRFDAVLRAAINNLDRLDGRQQDVPLHQRGFGVMDEPPA